jgi:hypothetical protein
LLLLTGCITNTVTPEIASGNLENQEDITQSSNNFQSSSTGTVEEPAIEEPATEKVDTTKPVITGSRAPLPNSLGWNNTDVTVSFSCIDVGPVQSGIETNTVAGRTVTTEGKDQSVTNTGECIDAAGNVADPVTVSNINIDKTPPVLTITLPKNGKYGLNESVTATWSATDDLSGVEDSKAPKTIKIDTTSKGKKTITLPAGIVKDKAGNSSEEVTTSYEVIADTEEPVIVDSEDPEMVYPQKWSGLGMVLFHTSNTSEFDSYVDDLLNNGFTELRVGSPDWTDEWNSIDRAKAAVIRAVAKGANVFWGVTQSFTITAENWPDFRAAILSAAQWAQDNGVYEFKIGNEEEYHNDDTTLTDAQLIANLKSVATDVQAIFTNGNVSYSCFHENIADWVSAGKGDIDILASNIYREWGNHNPIPWRDEIDTLVSAFGADGTYLTEFSLHTKGLDDYSEDEAVQAAAITEMIDYIKDSEMTRAFYFCYTDTDWLIGFGARKDDGTYRLLWNQALLNTEPVKSTTVPIKTTIISLPGIIALIPRITR